MSAIPSPIQSLLDLFASDLADVRFGDVDATTLSGAAAEVETAAEALSAAQAVLDEARAKLQERQDVLMQHAQRALAYARVYAEARSSSSLPTIRSRRDARADVRASTRCPRPRRRPRSLHRRRPRSRSTRPASDARPTRDASDAARHAPGPRRRPRLNGADTSRSGGAGASLDPPEGDQTCEVPLFDDVSVVRLEAVGDARSTR